MSKLIDAEKLDFVSYQGIPNGYKDSFDSGVLYAMNLIDECRTIDAVPVVHGHWYVYETGYEDTEAKCSICGFETLVNEPGNGLHMVGDLKYCPHCGAWMR